ncbi:MAG: YIP1 family protein [Ignavibacteriaceae bacterium]
MESNNGHENNNILPSEETAELVQELSHTDKIVGIFTEPAATFKSMSLFPLRLIDWLLPVVLLLILVSLSVLVSMTNPILRSEAKKMRYEAAEKQIDAMVKSGTLTEEQASEQMKTTEKSLEMMDSPTAQIFSGVSILVFGLIFFFIICGAYFVLAKFVLRGNGVYKSVLVASGMTSYISMIQVVLITIMSMLTDKWYRDLSIGSFMGFGKEDIAGYLLAKIDPINIWAYVILGIGLAKLFKSEETRKYIIMVFALWIGWSLIAFFIAKAVPFLSFLNS